MCTSKLSLKIQFFLFKVREKQLVKTPPLPKELTKENLTEVSFKVYENFSHAGWPQLFLIILLLSEEVYHKANNNRKKMIKFLSLSAP